MLAAMLLTVRACATYGDPVPALPVSIQKELSRVQVVGTCSVPQLPEPIQRSLAALGHETTLFMADPGEKWNDSCLLVPGLPRRQLVFAGRSGSHWLIQYWEGGYAPQVMTVVLEITGTRANVVWSGSCFETSDPLNSPTEMLGIRRTVCMRSASSR
jgi:hypothetical protein